MKIGIDVDGVLANHVPHILSRINQKYGLTLRKNDIKLWNQPVGDTDIEIEIERAMLDKGYVLDIPIIEGAREALENLTSKHCIIIVTNRPRDTDKATLEWLRRNRLRFRKLENTSGFGKEKLLIDVLVDDSLENVKEFALAKGVGILFSQPWNEDHISIVELIRKGKVVCASNWQDVVRIIERL